MFVDYSIIWKKMATTNVRQGKKMRRVELEPFVDFTSGYFMRAMDQLPKQGNKGPWTVKQNFLYDRKRLGQDPIDDGVMEFGKVGKEIKTESVA